MRKALAIVGVASCLAATARAAGPSQVPEGLLACAKIEDTEARVRCYDAQVAAMKQAPGSAARTASPTAGKAPAAPHVTAPAPSAATGDSTAPSSTHAAGAARQNSAIHFGEEELPPALQPKRNPKGDTLASSIAGVTKGPPGVYYFSLANGQVWRADGSSLALDPVIGVVFRVGAPVRIERGALGSYHMWAPAVGAKNWMYVRRIR